MNVTLDISAAAIQRALGAHRFDQAFEMASERMNQMPGDPTAWCLMALVTHMAGDPTTTLQILGEAVRRFPASQFARMVLILEIGAQANSVDDLSEIEELVATDFHSEVPVANGLRFLLCRPTDETVGLPFDVDGCQFSWPLFPARRGYELLYQHLPYAHNGLRSMERFYADFARYEANNMGRMNRIGPLIAREVELASGAAVLDAGCGTGDVLAYLVDLFNVRPFGVDLADGAGVIARRLMPDLDFRVCKLESIPHEDSVFDCVVCSDVLEHVRRPWLVLAELIRVCRPGGTLVISVPDGRYDDYIGHLNFFSTQSLEALLEDHGDVRISTHTDGLLAVVALRR